MVLIGLLLVALACLVVGLILANAVWLIGSLVASAVAGYLLFRQREKLAVRAGTGKDEAAPITSPAGGSSSGAAAAAAAPASRPSPQPKPAQTTANPEQQVWVVDTLPQFHTQDCAAIQNLDSEAIPLSQAVEDGFTECTVCKPTPSATRTEQVWVVDGRPDYHLEDCRSLKVAASQQHTDAEQIPRAQAVEDGFAPCPDCRPDGAAAADAPPAAAPADAAAADAAAPADAAHGDEAPTPADAAHGNEAPTPATAEPERPPAAEPARPDTVWVVDGRPRYHLSDCMIIKDQEAQEIPLAQATEDGFMACSMCEPAAARA